MADKHDPMSPEASPDSLKRTGVRRVNGRPLIIALAIFSLFVLMVVFVAFKRAAEQTRETAQKPHITNNTDTSAMAAQVIGNRTAGVIPPPVSAPLPPVAKSPALPIVKVNNPNVPPPPPRLDNVRPMATAADPALDQLRMAKLQAFEQAVKAQTRIPLPAELKTTGMLSDGQPNGAFMDRQQMLARIAAVRQQANQASAEDGNTAYQASLQRIRANLNGGDAASASLPTNDIQQFAANSKHDRWRLNLSMEAPDTSYEIRTGTVIPGKMISGINSELPGQIQGQVSQNIYDTATGKYLLIPQGTRLIGTYSSNIIYGQSAVLIAWQRLIFPDGKALDIGAMPGADSAGYTGFRDQVDNHYLRIFGSAFLMSAVISGIAYSQDQNRNNGSLFSQPTLSSEMSQALGQELGQVTAQMIAKNLNIAPTIKIRPGYDFNIMVTKDIVFAKPYQSFDY